LHLLEGHPVSLSPLVELLSTFQFLAYIYLSLVSAFNLTLSHANVPTAVKMMESNILYLFQHIILTTLKVSSFIQSLNIYGTSTVGQALTKKGFSTAKVPTIWNL
jgi:hypothetical protein